VFALWAFIFYGQASAPTTSENFFSAFGAGKFDALTGFFFATYTFHS